MEDGLEERIVEEVLHETHGASPDALERAAAAGLARGTATGREGMRRLRSRARRALSKRAEGLSRAVERGAVRRDGRGVERRRIRERAAKLAEEELRAVDVVLRLRQRGVELGDVLRRAVSACAEERARARGWRGASTHASVDLSARAGVDVAFKRDERGRHDSTRATRREGRAPESSARRSRTRSHRSLSVPFIAARGVAASLGRRRSSPAGRFTTRRCPPASPARPRKASDSEAGPVDVRATATIAPGTDPSKVRSDARRGEWRDARGDGSKSKQLPRGLSSNCCRSSGVSGRRGL